MKAQDGKTPVRVPKTAELVARNLRSRIVRRQLAEGDALPSETVLMEEFGVSRPTLREAFRVLESESLISVRRGSHGGAHVHVPDGDLAARYAGFVLEHQQTPLADVSEARLIVEPGCAGMLARSRTAADLKQLRAALEHATSFHRLVVELAGNETLGILAGMLETIVTTTTRGGKPLPSDCSLDVHQQLIERVEARDAAGAELLWRDHLEDHAAPRAGLVEVVR